MEMESFRYVIRYSRMLACSLSILILSITIVHANSLGASGKGGTLGLGLEIDYQINKAFNLRLQANRFNYTRDFDENGIEYTGELDLSSAGILIDWRPFIGNFRLTAGIYSNSTELTGIAIDSANEKYDIGYGQYWSANSNDPLIVNARIELGKSTAGYLGIGWGNSSASGFMYSFELGALFAGKPNVSLNASGTAAVSVLGLEYQFNVQDSNNLLVQTLNENLRVEEANLANDISEFEIYPVIAFGIGYRF